MVIEHTRLRPCQKSDLAPLVDFWNNAFADRRNFYPISVAAFQSRILACEAFHPDGLILAWHTGQDGSSQLVGLVHAFRPAPKRGLYLRWEQRHNLTLLYVDPAHRRQGIGSRLLRAAENWLYYCPVYIGGPAQPCYGTVEGPRPPFFGSTQQLGISAHDSTLIHFLSHRGYHVVDPGDVSMRLTLTSQEGLQKEPVMPPVMPIVDALGLQLVSFSHEQPFQGQEPEGRAEYMLYGNNGGDPYFGYAFVTTHHLLQGHISWYPMRQAGNAAIAGFWVAPSLRGHGLGRYLLDRALYDLTHAPPPWGGYQSVEVETHLVRHAQAAALYERRGFETDAAWVNMSKECAVRGANPQD
jgi:GNAT superfamily N-acetyltransferase